MKLTTSQKRELARYKRDAAALGYGPKKKGRHKGVVVNEQLPLPKASAAWIRGSLHPKRGPELRCMVCGSWYEDHRAGEFQKADWDSGVALVRNQAGGYAAGGGYRSKGPVLWAMRVLKTEDFNAAHTAYHGDPGEWRVLLPWENVATFSSTQHYGVKRLLAESNKLGLSQADDTIWLDDTEAGILTYDARDRVWIDKKGGQWECPVVAGWEQQSACSLADIAQAAADAGDADDVPF